MTKIRILRGTYAEGFPDSMLVGIALRNPSQAVDAIRHHIKERFEDVTPDPDADPADLHA